jgi:thiamine kinase-like enzyme
LEYLKGGRENKIARSGATVHRPSGHWSKSVHALLNHLRKVGFLNAPKPLGFDEKGNEILTYISGEVSNYPLSKTASSNEALITGAQLLRAYHDATVSFLNNSQQNHSWLLPVRNPAEVICHGDFAPYNVVLNGCKAVAIIDFDIAHPGPRVWDIAYALYRWSPLKNPNNPDTQGNLVSQIYRARQFCDAYHLPAMPEAAIDLSDLAGSRHSPPIDAWTRSSDNVGGLCSHAPDAAGSRRRHRAGR